jgi:Fe-S oxidoreductase/nitrate reductase gamma subunit
MLPLSQKIAFLCIALIAVGFGARGFYGVYLRIRSGRSDTDTRFNNLPKRLLYALGTTLTQSRTFRKRPWVSFFHSLIFYGFVFYLLVNLVDAVNGFIAIDVLALGLAGRAYILLADIFSALVLVGVVALVVRRFALPSRRDFRFNARTLVDPEVQHGRITRDSLIVSGFILFHVGSRALGAAAEQRLHPTPHLAPFAALLSRLIAPQHAYALRIAGYWGALGSVLLFLAYFPYSKHLHLLAAPVKYFFARDVNSGTLPTLPREAADSAVNENPNFGADTLEDLAWPRLLDAYACIQCNRCQDVCPATATGKSLSPSALEINKRMELNRLAHRDSDRPAAPARPLLDYALTVDALWACTTCGACVDVCPVQDEPMLDIIDMRRQQVMVEGEFPVQLQSAFRGMERAKNPWGVNPDKRLDWAAGLSVRTIDEHPTPEVLFWVGCAPSFDPQSQKSARAFAQLMQHAGVDFAVLGKQECCTGDSARRAGNEYLFTQLAEENVSTLNRVAPKRIVTTCPHCMNALGNEYRPFGGEYTVSHHTEFLDELVSAGKLQPVTKSVAAIAFHDPCYLGRHNDVYDAPRNVLRVLNQSLTELPRNRENSFCCGAGGAQFWKEEEPGDERISSARFREAQQTLSAPEFDGQEKVLAVGCPFCKSMLQTGEAGNGASVQVKDIAELLLESLQLTIVPVASPSAPQAVVLREQLAAMMMPPSRLPAPIVSGPPASLPTVEDLPIAPSTPAPRKKWQPKSSPAPSTTLPANGIPAADAAVVSLPDAAPIGAPADAAATPRKKWVPKAAAPKPTTPKPTTPEGTE